jgi:hypothetical protein
VSFADKLFGPRRDDPDVKIVTAALAGEDVDDEAFGEALRRLPEATAQQLLRES